ncbi:dephospho-CoA kinase [Rhizobium sp. KVB221]|uniref:Dephospho-CoA kinase n=1 Tax=Rhizobium setariae TaxID=2801340 RepID=A0A936YST8_9HYPH|nr:dephospho-CoA kinase [Rhizobium setariae]MBL0374156.1 dephospho-CoA kinase [Rhizobium setariae]
MIRLGLTGSIGMGKSTTASMFAEEGVPVIDADGIVHELYQGKAATEIEQAFPGTVVDGVVDRTRLSAALSVDPSSFRRLEAIVHPLVWKREQELLDAARQTGADIAVLDIPLLFENHAEARVDKVVVVTCDPELQRARVLARPGMTEDKFALILSRQLSDTEKRKRADFIIDTGLGLESARARVTEILSELRSAKK